MNEQINDARSHWAKSAQAKKQWTESTAKLAKDLPKFPDKVWLHFNWQVKQFGCDPDNVAAAAKYIMDGLTKAGVLTKDSLMIVQSPVIHDYSKGDGVVELTISDRPIFKLEKL